MTNASKVAAGDWVVFTSSYRGYQCAEVVRATNKLFYYVDKTWGSRECQGFKSAVVYSGGETRAKQLAEQLHSSYALRNQEQVEAYQRRLDRDAKLIAEARGEQS